ncbi:MAG: hypothetical protein KIT24_08165 [Phycisphaeraceae bacterium]|nr:hypothetical protein [Phycisphaeraceae bacterium]
MARKTRNRSWLSGVSLAVLAFVAAVGGYRLARTSVARDVYRERLVEVARAYHALREEYNAAVRKTAVTELIVRDGTLFVRVRNAGGEVREMPTPFDPREEIFVDYALLDNRLYIRRVFDARTPPMLAMVVDAGLGSIDWNAPGAAHGKVVYRSLGEGRWVITATGNGAIGLARAEGEADLAHAPQVRDYSTITEETAAKVGEISFGEVMGRMLGLD